MGFTLQGGNEAMTGIRTYLGKPQSLPKTSDPSS